MNNASQDLLNSSLEEHLDIAEIDAGLKVLMNNLDDMFLTVMGTIILLMQAGFAFLEAGSVRAKNTTNILIKNFADLCFGGFAFWLCGYALAFGEGNSLIGLSHFAAINLPYSKYTFLFFQSTFAATCTTIVSGAIAERCHFNGYIIFSAVVTGVIYPIPAHWCWGDNGWLAEKGFYDFAGSGVVHMAGGVCALIGAIILGPRIDRFKSKDNIFIPGHSFPLVALGGFILVTGFMAFNGGSQGTISSVGDGEKLGRSIMASLVACAGGGMSVLFLHKIIGGTWSLAKIVNGCLSGMVSIASGCDGFAPWMALVVASLSGPLHIAVSSLMVRLKIDDPVDAVAVHCASGLLGLILNPILRNDGVLMTGSKDSLNMLLWNFVGGLCLIFYYVIMSAVLFLTLEKLHLFRVDAKAEKIGLDIIKHNERAYDYSTIYHTKLDEDTLRSLNILFNPADELKSPGDVTPNPVDQTDLVVHTNNLEPTPLTISRSMFETTPQGSKSGRRILINGKSTKTQIAPTPIV